MSTPTDRACSCAEQATLHDDDHCCMSDWDGETRLLPCGHEDDFRARARAAAVTAEEVTP